VIIILKSGIYVMMMMMMMTMMMMMMMIIIIIDYLVAVNLHYSRPCTISASKIPHVTKNRNWFWTKTQRY